MRSWRTWHWSLGHRGSPPCSWTTGIETWGSPPPPHSSAQPTSPKAPISGRCTLAQLASLWGNRTYDDCRCSECLHRWAFLLCKQRGEINQHNRHDAAGFMTLKVNVTLTLMFDWTARIDREWTGTWFSLHARKRHQNTRRLLSLALQFRADAVSEVSFYNLEHAFAAGQVWSQRILTCMPKGWCNLQHGFILQHPTCESLSEVCPFEGAIMTCFLCLEAFSGSYQ